MEPKKIQPKEAKFYAIVSGIFIGLALILFFLATFAVDIYQKQKFETVIHAIDKGLQTDQEYLLEQARDLDRNQVFDRHIRSGDIALLLSSAIAERDRRGLDGLLITDAQGQVLTRSKAVQQRGDFIYHTTIWGRELANGREVMSVEAGSAFPLDVLGAVPMEREGEMFGSIVPAYIVDDDYANRFRDTYLPSDTEIGFHAPSKGIVGDSFSDTYGRILAFYFGEGIETLRNGDVLNRVAFNGDRYFVRTVELVGIDRSPGSVLVFRSTNDVLEQSLLAFALVCIFLSIFIWLIPLGIFNRNDLFFYVVVVTMASLVFVATYLTHGRLLEQNTSNLKQPTYAIYNSTLELDPPVAALNRQSEHRVGIRLFSGGEAVNATEVQLAFDPEQVRVADMSFSRSWCSQDLIIQREIDNENGVVTIVCGTPNPGFFERSGIVADLFIQPIQEGRFALSFTDRTRVLANDGLATEVLRQAVNGSYVVANEFNISTSTTDFQPLVFSSTHPNPERWYNARDITFTWTQREGVSHRYSFTRADNTNMDTFVPVAGDSVELEAPENGVHQFRLEAENDSGSAENEFIVRVDTVPPNAPQVHVSNNRPMTNELVRFAFSGSDELSGLQSNFYIKFNDGVFFPVGESFSTVFLESGEHTITVRSFDNANNFSETEVTVSVQSPFAAAIGNLFY